MASAYVWEEPWPQTISYREATWSGSLSGDLIEVFPCARRRTTMLMADVSGRGVRSSMYAQFLRRSARELAEEEAPATVLNVLNVGFGERTDDHGDDDSFASVFIASFQGRVLRYASAGHDFALLVSAGGVHQHLPSTGLALGINDAERYQERSLYVESGDRLVIVSDGVTEARNRSGGCFGTRGVAKVATAALNADAGNPAAAILDAARDHCRGRFTDDASVLYVTFV